MNSKVGIRKFKLVNVKGRIFFKYPIKSLQLKLNNITLNSYRNGDNNINFTGVKSIGELQNLKISLERTLNNCSLGSFVDCLFLNCKGTSQFDLKKLFLYLKENQDYFTSYEAELFSGLGLAYTSLSY